MADLRFEWDDDKALRELNIRLTKYNAAIEAALKVSTTKYVYTVIPIALGLTGALIAGALPGIALAGAAGLVQIARFWKFDRKPVIDNGDLDGAAMIYDAKKLLR